MAKSVKQRFMVSQAIQRVLADKLERMSIGSLADLKRAYEKELAVHGTEIEAEADAIIATKREAMSNMRTTWVREHRACQECGEPIEDAQSTNRLFCSGRCRQRAYRKRRDSA